MRREQFVHDAQAIFSLADNGRIKAVVSAISFTNAAYIMRKYVENGQLAFVLRQFATLVDISSIDCKTVQQSIDEDSKFTDIEDAMQYYSALDFGCECIVTRNTKDFSQAKLPIYTPSEFLKIYS